MPQDTALIRAVMLGDIKKVLPLITPTTINAQGKLGKTALHNAVIFSSTSDAVVDALLNHGADVNVHDDNGDTPMSDAAQDAHAIDDVYARRVCKLIERGAVWPQTERGIWVWQRLTAEVQQLFTEKLQAYQQQQARLQKEEQTQAFGMLSGYAGHLHASSNPQSFVMATFPTGLHHRSNSSALELNTFN